ncbi:MAG: hypothetical protein ACUVX1_03440 [Chloroflexota bacterium]
MKFEIRCGSDKNVIGRKPHCPSQHVNGIVAASDEVMCVFTNVNFVIS